MTTNAKEIVFEEEARQYLLTGIDKVAKTLAFTLGPKGGNVCLEKSWGSPSVTRDGNDIVQDIEFKNKFENMGVSMAKEVATKMKEKCGDGVALGIVLLPSLSKAIKQKNQEEIDATQNRSLEFSLLISLPSAAGLFILSKPIIHTLFERGAFVLKFWLYPNFIYFTPLRSHF